MYIHYLHLTDEEMRTPSNGLAVVQAKASASHICTIHYDTVPCMLNWSWKWWGFIVC